MDKLEERIRSVDPILDTVNHLKGTVESMKDLLLMMQRYDKYAVISGHDSLMRTWKNHLECNTLAVEQAIRKLEGK